MQQKKVLSAAEAAEMLNVCKPVFYRICKTPGFPAIRVGRTYRIPYDGLMQWMEHKAGEQVL